MPEERSTSSMTKEYFLQSDIPVGFVFETQNILDALKAKWPEEAAHTTYSAVSGYLSKLVTVGALSYSDNGKVRTFTLQDKKAVESLNVRERRGIGSLPGSHEGIRHNMRRRPTVAGLAERLFEIAADIERLQPALASVSTKDLLEELQRRTERQVV